MASVPEPGKTSVNATATIIAGATTMSACHARFRSQAATAALTAARTTTSLAKTPEPPSTAASSHCRRTVHSQIAATKAQASGSTRAYSRMLGATSHVPSSSDVARAVASERRRRNQPYQRGQPDRCESQRRGPHRTRGSQRASTVRRSSRCARHRRLLDWKVRQVIARSNGSRGRRKRPKGRGSGTGRLGRVATVVNIVSFLTGWCASCQQHWHIVCPGWVKLVTGRITGHAARTGVPHRYGACINGRVSCTMAAHGQWRQLSWHMAVTQKRRFSESARCLRPIEVRSWRFLHRCSHLPAPYASV